MKKLLVFAVLFILSCGGGGSFSESPVSVEAKLASDTLVVKLNELTEEKVGLNVSVSGGGIFNQSVNFRTARLDYYSIGGSLLFSREVLLDFKLSIKEKASVNLPLVTVADKLSFSAPIFSNLLGRVVCTRDAQGQIIACTRNFSGVLSQEPLPGYCNVFAGNLRLVERIPGVFSGDGTGLRNGREVQVYFSSDPQEGVHVIATCISRTASLNIPYRVDISIETDRGSVAVGSVYLRYAGSFAEVIGQ